MSTRRIIDLIDQAEDEAARGSLVAALEQAGYEVRAHASAEELSPPCGDSHQCAPEAASSRLAAEDEAPAVVLVVAIGDRERKSLHLSEAEAARERLKGLTARELEVLKCLVAGDSNKKVAEKLRISHRTVEFHRAHIMRKSSAQNIADLVRLWLASQ